MKIKLNYVVSILVITIWVISGFVAANANKDNAKKTDELNTLNPTQGTQAIGNEYAPEEIIVKFKSRVKDEKISKINSKHGTLVLSTSPLASFKRLKIPKGKTVSEMVGIYNNDPDVEYAEPNYIAYALMTPNDPYYVYQWHLYNPQYGGINVEKAWDISTGTGVTVAVIDTGVAYENYGLRYKQAPDLANTCFVQGYDFVNNDAHPNDDNSHGTHIAGTIAQSTNNGVGVAGIAFKVCIMPVKVLDKRGSGTYDWIANGIYYAADHGANVISISLGGPSPSTTLENAIKYAFDKGVTIVAAAGNDGMNGAPSYPAAYDAYIIAVGATRYDEARSPYSTTGGYVDIVAPGGDLNVDQNGDGYKDGVLQNTFNPNTKNPSDFGYWFLQGTSMATPHVSGVVALILQKNPTWSPADVREDLEKTTEDKGASGWDPEYGWGVVDAYAALNYVKGCTSDTDCNDNNVCTTDSCDATTKQCVFTPLSNGTLCDDELFCTINGQCTSGVCGGIAKDCSDGVACTVDSCDEVKDICANTPNNPLCDDGLHCNGVETCDATLGCKAGILVSCNDGNSCTTDSCSEIKGACEYIWLACGLAEGCCGAVCNSIKGDPNYDPDCPSAVKCWTAEYKYLYKNYNQAKKFCKCAQGTYGYKRYNSIGGTKTTYQYIDTGNNENWAVTSRSSSNPVYKVQCANGNWYNTNQDYYFG